MISKDSKTDWMDNLRVFATFSVIIVHVSSSVLSHYGTIPNSDWWAGNIYDGMSRFCVPIFLMLTGALLLPKTYEINDFLKRRFSRIVLPFLFWSIIYILYELILKVQNGENISLYDLAKFIFLQFRDGAAVHLWYIYLIIGIYLFIPIISKWIINSSKKEILYFIIVWMIAIFFELPKLSKLKPDVDLSYFSGYIGYPVLGYYLIKFVNKNVRKLSLLLIVIGTSITIYGTYFVTYNTGIFDEVFYDYLSPNVICTSVGVFLFFRDMEFKNPKFNMMTKFISKYSYGIYLSHILVLLLLIKIGISWEFVNPIIGIPIISILCLITALAITFGINKIPYGKYISG